MKIGVALSGGGLRGAAHIGVLKALEQRKIPINMIGGCSMGGFIAALYACGYRVCEIEDIMIKISVDILNEFSFLKKLKDAFNKSTFKTSKFIADGILSGNKMEKYIRDVFLKNNYLNFSDAKIPLAVPAVDINTMQTVMFVSSENAFIDNAQCVHFSDVKLWEGLRAAMSIPVIFKPKMINGYCLVDGGIKNNLPISPVKALGADRVFAVNITTDFEKCPVSNMIDIFFKTIDYMSSKSTRYCLKGVDFALNIKFDSLVKLEMDKIEQIINFGYETAQRKLDVIEQRLLI